MLFKKIISFLLLSLGSSTSHAMFRSHTPFSTIATLLKQQHPSYYVNPVLLHQPTLQLPIYITINIGPGSFSPFIARVQDAPSPETHQQAFAIYKKARTEQEALETAQEREKIRQKNILKHKLRTREEQKQKEIALRREIETKNQENKSLKEQLVATCEQIKRTLKTIGIVQHVEQQKRPRNCK